MDMNLPVVAGTISTIFFLAGELPMLAKAFRSKELRSYSIGNITIANAGNMVHSVYVYSMPPGPIWILHTFYMLSAALMLFWYVRYEGMPHVSLDVPTSLVRRRMPTIPSQRQIPRSITPSGE